MLTLIADSGATSTRWELINDTERSSFKSDGLSPIYMSSEEIGRSVSAVMKTNNNGPSPARVFFYGTGCSTKEQNKVMKTGLEKVFPDAEVLVSTDLVGAARALCGKSKGVACILGTGSNSAYYNGNKIVKNNPAPGFILGDEGSGAYLGKKVLQHFIYNTFEPDLMDRFNERFQTDYATIIRNVYKGEFPSRYLAGFSIFLSENRGHFMVENILEDGINDFIQTHIFKYPESWKYPIHFTGSISFHFRDVIQNLFEMYKLQLGQILPEPIEGLVKYHKNSSH